MRTIKMPHLGKRWIDKDIITSDGSKKRLRKLTPLGNSLALLLPKFWIDLACKPDSEGKYWVEIEANVNRIIITGHKGE